MSWGVPVKTSQLTQRDPTAQNTKIIKPVILHWQGT